MMCSEEKIVVDFICKNMDGNYIFPKQNLSCLQKDSLYEIGLTTIVLELNSVPEHSSSQWMLTTNLIDRNSLNENQSISYFTIESNKDRLVLNFASVDFFPLERIHSLPFFCVKDPFGERKLNIRNVIIRICFKRCLDSVNH